MNVKKYKGKRMHLNRQTTLTNVLTDLHQNKDEKVTGLEFDKNKILEKECKGLVDEIFSLMNKKGFINNMFEAQLDQIEKLQLIRKFSKY